MPPVDEVPNSMTARQAVLLAMGVVVVSFAAPMIRLADAPPLTVAMYRNLFATAVLLPLALVRNRGEMRAIRRADVAVLFAAGLLLALHFGTWVPSVNLTTVAASTVLVSTSPLWSAGIARIFLGERLRRTVAIGIGIAFAGAALISGFDFTLSARAFGGDMLALIGAAAVAGHRIVALGPRRRLSLIPFVAIMYGVCSVALLVVVLASGIPLTGFEAETWLWMILIAIGPQVVGHTLFNLLLRDVDPTVLATAIMGEAVGATLLALALFGEVPTAGAIAGGVLLLLGIFIAIRAQSPRTMEALVE
jgi:drug/metabolite transporter (DMT)-like permease